jgi:hypothetical protein
MDWPVEWNMDTYKSGNAPERIVQPAKYIFAQIALKFIDPDITFETHDETGELTYGT